MQATITASVLFVLWLRPLPSWTRRQAAWFGTAWVVLSTAEYWLLGPFSFASEAVDLDYSIPFFLHLNDWWDGARYSHAFAGGNDVYAMSVLSGQYVSIERLFLAAFPLWLAHMLFKIMIGAVGFAGAYRLCRRFANGERAVAAGLAAVFTLSHYTLTMYSWAGGLGYALIPLTVEWCVVRVGKRGYWPGVVALAAVHAIGGTPTYSAVGLFPTLVLAAFLISWRHLWRVIPAILVIAAFLLLNWHESLYAKMVVGPHSYRGSAVSLAGPEMGIIQILGEVRHSLGQFPESVILVLAAIAFMLARRRDRLARVVVAASVSACLGPLLIFFSWESIGLGLLRGFNFGYATYSITAIAIVAFALAVAGGAREADSRPTADRAVSPRTVGGRVAVALPLALAAGLFGWYKALNGSTWLSEGGLSLIAGRLETYRNADWLAEEPVRVVSVPYRLPPNLAPAAGLHSFDGALNLGLRSAADFWQHGVLPVPKDMSGGYVELESAAFDMKCCRLYDITRIADTNLLRIANVGFVLSVLPLHGGGIVRVAGPRDESVPPRNTDPIGPRLRGYAKLIFEPPPVYAYRLPAPLPRVFAAKDVIVAPAGATEDAFLDLVGRHALDRVAVVRPEHDPARDAAQGSAAVLGFDLVRDGFDIRTAAPRGGLIMVNAAYSPFWTALADGATVPVKPANAIQMGVAIPPGTTAVSLRYERALLRERAWAALVKAAAAIAGAVQVR